jgi:hypothetical protein
MGWFGNLIGSAERSVAQNGILGRGEITGLTVSGITLARATDPAHSAADVLANGKPIRVVLVGDQPLGKKNADGVEIYALQLTAYEGVDTPYQLTVGNPVPATALPLLFPGSKLNARLGDGPNSVVVDWAAGAAT